MRVWSAAAACLLLPAWLAVGAPARQDGLEDKARHFREALVRRHLSPEGLVLYRINLTTIDHDLRTGSYPSLADTPTFTGQFAAVSCTRAGVERGAARAEARSDAARALDGLRVLMDVTGVRGLLARSLRRDAVPELSALRGRWFPGAQGFQAYSWRGDVSLDQYTNGLLPAVAACRTQFPERARRLVVDSAAHLLEHGMRLVDPDGRPTSFGNLGPCAGLGFNGIALLTGYAVFALAASMDPDPRWARQRDRLRDRDRVVARALFTNLRILGITNYSNDLMAWNLYRVLVPLARRSGDPALPDLRYGMFRAWLRVRNDGNPYFAGVLCSLEPASCQAPMLREARDFLARFPREKRLLPLNPALAQVPRRRLPGRKFRPQARKPVPIELRPASSFEWKSSPYRLDGAVMPGWSVTGLDYLAAYWLYRSLPEELQKLLKRP